MSALFTDAVLMRSLLFLLLLGSVAGLFAGIILLLRPEWLVNMSVFTNRWVSTRQMGRSLEQSVNIDHWLYRYGHVSGALLLASAIYIVYVLTTHLVRADIVTGLAKMYLVPKVLVEPVLDTMILFFLAGAVLAMLISLFLIFRPSMLRELELGANQSISLRQTLKPMEIQRGNMDQLVFRNVRLAGIALLCGSLYTLVMLVSWLIR